MAKAGYLLSSTSVLYDICYWPIPRAGMCIFADIVPTAHYDTGICSYYKKCHYGSMVLTNTVKLL